MVSYSSLCVYWSWPEKYRNVQGVLVVIFCFVSQLSYGSAITFGNIIPYIASYIRYNSKPRNFRYTDATYLYVVQTVITGISSIIGGLIEKQIGPRMVILIGSLLMAAGTLLSYFTIRHSFAALIVTYGFMLGVGYGFGYVVPISCAIKWWPNCKGTASAIVSSGYGLSPLIFNLIQTWFINPNNQSPNDAPYDENPQEKYFNQQEVLENVPNVFLLLGFIYFILQISGLIFFIYPKPEKSSKVKLAFRNPTFEGNWESKKLYNSNMNADSLQPHQMIRRYNFYILFIMFSIAGTTVYFFFSLYKTFSLEEVTGDDYFITIASSVGSVALALGKFFWGMLSDLTDYKFAMVVNSGMTTFLLYTFYATSIGGKAMLFIWIFGFNFSLGGYYVHFPIAISKSFGKKYLSANYGILFGSQAIGAVLVGLISDYAIIMIGWYGTFLLLGSLSLVHFLMALFYRHVTYSPKQYQGDLRTMIYSYLIVR